MSKKKTKYRSSSKRQTIKEKHTHKILTQSVAPTHTQNATQQHENKHNRGRHKKLYLNHVPIKVVSTQKALTVAVDKLLSYNPLHLGIDCEWKPQFKKGKKQNKVSLIQIAHNKLIILIRLNHLKNPNQSLSKSGMLAILRSKKIIKCGVGIIDDREKMYHDHGVSIERCIELNHLNMRPIQNHNDKPVPYLSLAKLCKKVLRREMQYKSKKITMSNWENSVLSDKQIMYAADDALTGYKILEKLLKLNHRMGSFNILLRTIDDYMDRKLVDQSLETCRQNMLRIAKRYEHFPLYDLNAIHWKLFRREMKKKHTKRLKKLVMYFNDIFEFDTSSQVVYSIHHLYD